MIAARAGQHPMVAFLLQQGANAALTSETGQTAESYATQWWHTRIVDLLATYTQQTTLPSINQIQIIESLAQNNTTQTNCNCIE